MKKLSKRFLTLAIACVMAMMMAVPAFADFDNGTTHTYHIKNNTIAGDYVYLNLYGTGGVYASRDVTVYPRTTSDDQVWYITKKVRDVKKVYNNRTDTSGNRYTLNINTNTNNCNVYPDYSSNDADSRVQIIGDMARFCIKLARSGLYVHALTDSTHNVLWSSSIQYWNELS